MQHTDLIALLPLILLSVFAAVIMLVIALKRHHKLTMVLSSLGLVTALFSLPVAGRFIPRTVTPLLVIDGYALFYMGLILCASLAAVLFSYDYLKNQNDYAEEYYLLMILAALGSMILVSSRHMASFFLGVEILSVSLYALVAYTRNRDISIEAGIKYLVLAGVSAGFFLFGAALIYYESGKMDFIHLSEWFQLGVSFKPIIVYSGLGLVIVAIGFKLAVTPFHMWTPDIYHGAPAPVTAFIATASKGAIAALLIRMFASIDLNQWKALYLVFAAMAMGSMIAGNLLALMQSNIKRILAYSSIAHMGYLLTAFLAGGRDSSTTVAFYLCAYAVSALGCFGIITVLSTKDRDADTLNDITGLFQKRPLLTIAFTAMVLSLAGIPLTAGFIGKFFVVSEGVKTAQWTLMITLVLTSGIGLFYYLRMIIALFSQNEATVTDGPPNTHVASFSLIVLTVLTSLVLWLGITPAWFAGMIRSMMG